MIKIVKQEPNLNRYPPRLHRKPPKWRSRRSEWREDLNISAGGYKKKLITSLIGILAISAIFYYKSGDYSPSNKLEESYSIPDQPFAIDSGELLKGNPLNSADNEMLKLGLAEDYRFWLDRIEEAGKSGSKEKEKLAKANLKNLLDKIMKLPEADIRFIQEKIGGKSLILP